MVHFSFSSVFMAVFMSNLMLAVVVLCLRNVQLLVRVGYRLVAVLCAVTLARFLFPFELPITRTVQLPRCLSLAVMAVQHPFYTRGGISVSAWTLFCVAWLAGGIVSVSRQVRDQAVVRGICLRLGTDVTGREPYASMLDKLCTPRQRGRVRLLMMDGLESPMVFGLWKPVVLLPAGMDVSDSDVLYALRHELYHCVNHDLWAKFAVGCLAAAYWWNPFSRKLSRQVGALMEMRIDDAILSEDADTARGYLDSLISYIREAGSRPGPLQPPGLFSDGKSALHRRVCMIGSRGRKPSYPLCALVLLLVLGLYVGSYLFVLEAFASPTDTADSYVVTDNDNCFAVQNADGTYDIYLSDGTYIETIDSLEYFPQDIKTYSSKEEYYEEMQKE